jgi:hypothetical protein
MLQSCVGSIKPPAWQFIKLVWVIQLVLEFLPLAFEPVFVPLEETLKRQENY